MAKKVKGNRVQVILECTEQKSSGVPECHVTSQQRTVRTQLSVWS